jgi:hypothetical protein
LGDFLGAAARADWHQRRAGLLFLPLIRSRRDFFHRQRFPRTARQIRGLARRH